MNKIEFINECLNELRSDKELPKIISFNNDLNLRYDLGLDSFDLALLTSKIEDEYDIDIFKNGLIETYGEIIQQL